MNVLKGVGLGLRSCHCEYIERERPDVSWFELLADNYLNDAQSLANIETIYAHYPVTLHAVAMSLGTSDDLNWEYLGKLKRLIEKVNPVMISDHLCWTSFAGEYYHELLPLIYREDVVVHVANRIRQVQDYLERQIMIENVSSYTRFNTATMTEWAFLNAVAEEADCLILLDINNIYVSGYNLDFNPVDYITAVNKKRVAQYHLGGFEDKETHLLDSHSQAIHQPVWELFKKALENFGPLPTCIEWDNQIPDFPRLQREAVIAQNFMESYAITT